MNAEKLRTKYLSDADSARLYRLNPELRASPDDFCPTCRKSGIPEDCDCELQLQLYKHYLNSGIGTQYMRLTWDDFVRDDVLKRGMQNYEEKHDRYVGQGIGTLIHGDYGVGKTMAAMLTMKHLVKCGYSVFCTSFSGMIEAFTAGWYEADEKTQFARKFKNSQVLLLDDVGKEFRSKTNLPESTFDDVLRHRVNFGRPTHITTNMSTSEMQRGYGSAIFSLLTQVSIVHEIRGSDYRPQVRKRTMAEIDMGMTRPIT
jgi:DNA replication protein DnaC